MFVDYVGLMLINMVGGLIVLALFLVSGMDEADRRSWAAPFLAAGIVGSLCGFGMVFTWPLPGAYNIAFGENSAMLGVLMLTAGLALARGWNLAPLSYYAMPAGLMAIVTGARFILLGLSKSPVLSGIGFILPGVAGLLAPLILRPGASKAARRAGALVLFLAALIWAKTGYEAVWGHLVAMGKWMPPGMR